MRGSDSKPLSRVDEEDFLFGLDECAKRRPCRLQSETRCGKYEPCVHKKVAEQHDLSPDLYDSEGIMEEIERLSSNGDSFKRRAQPRDGLRQP